MSCLVRQDEVSLEDSKRQDPIVGLVAKHKTEESLAVGVLDTLEDRYKSGLSCKLCKKQHNAIILHALGWGHWQRCASKAEQPLAEDYTQISAALTYLGVCLAESGRMTEAMKVGEAYQAWAVKTTRASRTAAEVIANLT